MVDLFYDIYYRKLMELSSGVRPRDLGMGSVIRGVVDYGAVNDVWKPLGMPNTSRDFRAVAVDGGVQELDFRNGASLVIVRAIAINNVGKPPTKDVIVKLSPVYAPALRWVLLTHVESSVAMKALEDGGYEFLLMDGSLYAKVTALIHELILTKGFLDLYFVPDVVDALERIYQLLVKARELGVKVMFVSKDTELKVFKDYVLFKTLKELILNEGPLGNIDKEVIDILNRGIEWHSVVWIRNYRKRLLDLAGNYNGSHRDLVRMGIRVILSQSVSDINVLEELAKVQGVGLGITRKLLIGAMDAYLNSKSLTNIDRLLRLINDRVEDSLGLRSVDEGGELNPSDYIRRVRRVLEEMPRILMFYVKPSKNDTPILVEVPYYEWPMFDQRVPWKLFFDKVDVSDHVNLLLSMYRDSIHYNKLLWLAHEYANFGSDQFLEYAIAAIDKLKIPAKRRFAMAYNMDMRGDVD
ncbi:DNA double-strand break repair nuclease NurA [Vulcanisaeta thermophila]|uniref:DNA double-strand break repair nuclease NurA n=1 Tax=Vulcanisaeta thermophila TaxID=867917 RepID=UPI0008537E32|nr:DNA double-strand break repair nuclease NurA [Vulcanisaeta thermophila]